MHRRLRHRVSTQTVNKSPIGPGIMASDVALARQSTRLSGSHGVSCTGVSGGLPATQAIRLSTTS